MNRSFFAILATAVIASCIPLQVSYATETTPATSTSATSTSTAPSQSSASTLQVQEQSIHWKVEQLEAKKITPMNVQHYKKYVETPGNQLVVYGLTLADQLPLLQQIYTPSNGKFRFDFESMTSKDQGGNINKEVIVFPTFISFANVNGAVQVTYGTKNITATTKNRDELRRDLQKESYGLRKELENLIESEVEGFVIGFERKRQIANSKPAFDSIGLVRTFHIEANATAPLIGTLEGYWVINKGDRSTSDNRFTYTVDSDFTFSIRSRGIRSNNGLGPFEMDSFKTGIKLINETDEMVSASPLASGLYLDGDKGVSSPKWPASGYSAQLDGTITPGPLGTYLLNVKQKNLQYVLPEAFPLQFSTTFSSTKPTVSFETQQWFRTIPRKDTVYFASANDIIRND